MSFSQFNVGDWVILALVLIGFIRVMRFIAGVLDFMLQNRRQFEMSARDVNDCKPGCFAQRDFK